MSRETLRGKKSPRQEPRAFLLSSLNNFEAKKTSLYSDIFYISMTAAIREVFANKPAEFDPRKYLGPARDNMKKLYIHKIKEVLGSDNKA